MSLVNKVMLDVAFHQGRTIMDTARTYPNLLKVLLEVVQNGIDSGARRIEVKVNRPRRTFVVYDNGSGCNSTDFQRALRSLNSSMKDSTKYGQFGRGLVAPLSVAEGGFTFTSCKHPSKGPYFTYYFDPAKIEPQEQVKIPGEEAVGLAFDPNGKTWWRTAVEAKKLSRDRFLSALTLRGLIDEIALKFGEAIRSRQIMVSVTVIDADDETASENVVAPEYTGEKLDTKPLKGQETGSTILELYIARRARQGRKGKVVVGTTHNPSRISMEEFIENTRGLLKGEVASGLRSGIFEGKVLCEKLKLNPDRTRFERDESLAELCIQLETWWDTQGKAIVTELRNSDDESRYQELGKAVIPFAKLLLRQERFKNVAEAIRIGSIGQGHAKVDKKNILGIDPETSISVNDRTPQGGDSGDSGGSGENGGGTKTPPKKEHPRHSPGTVYGPRGKRRTEVVDSSTGLHIVHAELEDINIPFTFETSTGTLTFNLDHPDWGKCEESDRTLMLYEIAVFTVALTLELYRNGTQPLNPLLVEFAHASLHEQVFAIMNGEAMIKLPK